MITGYFQSIMDYCGVWWSGILGHLAVQVRTHHQALLTNDFGGSFFSSPFHTEIDYPPLL